MRNYREEREGQKSVNRQGLEMTLRTYRSATDTDVVFPDGAVREHVSWDNFIRGNLRHPDESLTARRSRDYLGKTVTNRDGIGMTMTAYRSAKDIDVRFEDGAVRTGARAADFVSGKLKHPDDARPMPDTGKRKSREGEVMVNRDGELVTITAYRSCTDIDVRFENGQVCRHRNYRLFRLGKLTSRTRVWKNTKVTEAYRKKRIGEEGENLSGEKMTITGYRNSTDMDVTFEDGTVRSGVSYSDFIKGHVSRTARKRVQESHLGEVSRSARGEKMVLVAYSNSLDVTVRFEDGGIRERVPYVVFQSGRVRNPKRMPKARLGQRKRNRQGLWMEITEYRNANDIDIRFDDGAVARHRDYWEFEAGAVRHPSQSAKGLARARVGQRNKNTQGLEMEIIVYRGARDIDVRFPDGAVREHMSYRCFRTGQINHPDQALRRRKKG